VLSLVYVLNVIWCWTVGLFVNCFVCSLYFSFYIFSRPY